MIEMIDLTKIFTIRKRKLFAFHSSMDHKTIKALDHVNLKVRPGELFGLLGPNGAGKTTLIKLLSTLLIPDEGTAYVNGFSILEDPMNVRKSIGTLFSVGDRGFFWRLDGYKNLEFFASIYNVPRNKRKERIQQLLEIVGLSHESSIIYQRYSLGMKRKLMLARALLPDPPILFLDEPTANLDPISARSIRSYIKTTLSQDFKKTIIYTTHNIEEAAELCDRICVLHVGHVLALDTPDNIRNMVKTKKIIEIVIKNVTPRQIEQLEALNKTSLEYQVDNDETNQYRIQLCMDRLDSLSVIIRFLSQHRIEVVDLSYKKPTLEEAFIYLVQKRNQ